MSPVPTTRVPTHGFGLCKDGAGLRWYNPISVGSALDKATLSCVDSHLVLFTHADGIHSAVTASGHDVSHRLE
jgi:hypothetical protein